MASPSSLPTSSRNDITRRGRPRDELRRADLRDRACRILLEGGTAQVTLATLADRLGESPRVLVHHFGSRDGLIGAALEQARAQILDSFRAHLARHPVRDLRSLVAVLADLVQAPVNGPYFLLFGELGALATQAPHQYPGFARATVHDWLPDLQRALIAGGEDPAHVQAQATLALAIVRGLLLDQKATGEATRVQAAYQALADL
jgi:AcrR family transcriptional regulator